MGTFMEFDDVEGESFLGEGGEDAYLDSSYEDKYQYEFDYNDDSEYGYGYDDEDDE